MAIGNPNFDTIQATSLQAYASVLADCIFENQPYMWLMQENDRVRNYQGGRSIVEPLIHTENDTVATYSGYDPIDTTPQEGLSAAEFQIKQAAGTVTISGIEEAKNRGVYEQIDLLESKMVQLRESVVQFFDEMLINSDGTGNSGKDWDGLAVLIGDENVATTTGNIDASDPLNTWWRSNINTTGGALGLAAMRTMYNTISDGSDHPDLLLASQEQYEKYEALLQPNQQFRDGKMADAGFMNLLFKGVPMVFDRRVPADRLYFLNTMYLKLRPDPSRWFYMSPFLEPVNQDAKVAKLLMYGNQTINNRRRQGYLDGLTT